MLAILVIDDDPDMRLLTRRLLSMLGCQSYEARNGIEGETMATEVKPDAILLDIMMPIQDGYQTCLNLRTNGFSKPIIMVSALQEKTQAEKSQNAGATAYIQKPLTKDVLKFHLDHLEAQQSQST